MNHFIVYSCKIATKSMFNILNDMLNNNEMVPPLMTLQILLHYVVI